MCLCALLFELCIIGIWADVLFQVCCARQAFFLGIDFLNIHVQGPSNACAIYLSEYSINVNFSVQLILKCFGVVDKIRDAVDDGFFDIVRKVKLQIVVWGN